METNAETSDRCPVCKGEMLTVLYYGAEGESVGGHRICPGCGPRTAVELGPTADEIRRRLLERKAS